jgi:hypothetical protein
MMNSGKLTDNGTGSSGMFDVVNTVTVSGTIAAGETVTATGIANTNANISAASGLVNNGTIVLDCQTGASSGSATLSGGPVTNNGTVDSQVECSNTHNLLQASVTNAASGTIEVKSGELEQDTGTTTTNDGDVIIDAAGNLNLDVSTAAFDEAATATLTFDISGTMAFGTINFSGGSTFTFNGGTADPVLQGGFAPAIGTEFDVITFNGATKPAGTFTTILNAFTGDYAHSTFIGLVRAGGQSTTTLASSANPSIVGQTVTFTATVGGASGAPTGMVMFFDNGTQIGTGTLSGGVATVQTSSLTVGTHTITAHYGGDGTYASSMGTLSPNQVVNNKTSTTTALASSSNPSTTGQQVTFTATVASVPNGGTAAFTDGGAAIPGCTTVTVSTSNGTATCQVTYNAAGSHTIQVTFSGNPTFAGSQSTMLTQVVNSAAPPPTDTLTVKRAGTGAGTVSSSPTGISCPQTCAHAFGSGQTVTLTASASGESAFAGWSGGGCSGTGACTVTLRAAQIVTATFTQLIGGEQLFCGAQHRGKCLGIKLKTLFTGPGNAVWQFGLYNPSPGGGSKFLVLGTITKHVNQSGSVTITFSLQSTRVARLVAKGLKQHLTALRVLTTFTSNTGRRTRLIRVLNVPLG